jgi:hypothetical protein
MNPNSSAHRGWKIFGWLLMAVVVVSVILVALALAALGSMPPGTVEINGVPFTMASLDAGDWAIGIGAILFAVVVVLFVLLLVVPLVVLIPLTGALFGIAIALLGTVGAGIVALSPLIFIVGGIWLIVRLLRSNERKRREARAEVTGATIAG